MSVILPCLPLHAQTVDARQHLEKLIQANSLDVAGSPPWHLRMTFQINDLNGKPKDSGTIEEWWASPQSRRLEIRSASYNLTIPAGLSDPPEPSTPTREAYLVRQLLKEVVHPIPDYGDFQGLQVTEDNRNFGKLTLACISVTRPPRIPADFCFAPGSSVLRVHLDEAQFAAARNTISTFGGINLGFDNALAYGEKVAITAHTDKLEGFHPDGNIALSTSSVGPPPIIPGVVLAGHILKKAQPIYPLIARRQRSTGTVLLCARISKQGTITGLDVVSSPDPLLTESAMQAVRQWIYQPYLLNGSPTEVDTTITVNYNITAGPFH